MGIGVYTCKELCSILTKCKFISYNGTSCELGSDLINKKDHFRVKTYQKTVCKEVEQEDAKAEHEVGEKDFLGNMRDL